MVISLTKPTAALSVTVCLAAGALAEDSAKVLSASEIDLLLRGNTIEGTWSGSTYTQYFGEDGQTVYLEENRRPDVGRWRVNSETEQYESWWEQTGWTAYTVLETEGGFAWKRGDGHELFVVSEGKQITW
ncbi:hypothetical protein [Roseovarius rhodophyticola]|uniref:DUF995 domain-containing protein n=1 Tax=Roseovarius rhodophyticola TaxID=3080827 RepID=A0ABZ2TIH7_9RHOB|nr:hypothetical protein [Roseovarius sp. W115]MDV2929824.1 hypothetical protein [Roseovarius sp. W115]